MLRYPPLTGQEPAGSLRAAAHGDINLLTILPAANEPGLQVQDKQGEWLDVPCDFRHPGGQYRRHAARSVRRLLPVHPAPRVSQRRRREQNRISLPLFLHPRPEVVLSEHYTADSYLNERLRELGVKM